MAQTAGAAVHSLPYVQVPNQRRHAPKHRLFVHELSQALFDFVVQLLPTEAELAIKEDVRKLLERLIRTIEPESRLLSFGSTANGFSLRNSDMDLCCLIDSDERLSASDLVVMLGNLLERETKFHVKPLPHARIPIVKLSLDPSPGLPSGIACDIGFENRLALENTRMLMCYAMIDPTRVRTMVLFLKVWSKRRKINSPYHGTLSSYGYVLLVIYFLIHVKSPPVLPNLQQIPPLRPISKEDTHINGYNTWFFDDIELLCQRWRSSNTETVAELLIDFFRYYSRDFSYNTGVASIRAGLLKKESKGWQNDLSSSKYNDSRERNRFCIEDPFETDYNVARCVTKEGLYLIRGEFMRASRILAMRPRAIGALSQLCEEKIEDPQVAAPPPIFVPPRLSAPHQAQASQSIGNSSGRAKGTGRISIRPDITDSEDETTTEQSTPVESPPEYMAPKRSHLTSTPPPEAPPAQQAMFENQIDQGLVLATSSAETQECSTSVGSDDSSKTASDEDRRSEAGGSEHVHTSRSFKGDLFLNPGILEVSCQLPASGVHLGQEPRGRLPARQVASQSLQRLSDQRLVMGAHKAEPLRRAHSGPPNRKTVRFSWPSTSATIYPTPNGPVHTHTHTHQHHTPGLDTSTVFYETAANNSRFLLPLPHQHPVQHDARLVPDSHLHISPTPPYDDRQSEARGLEQHLQHISPHSQESGTEALEDAFSVIQHSDTRLDGIRMGDCRIEDVLGESPQASSSHRSCTPLQCAQTLPASAVARGQMVDSTAGSPGSPTLPLAQIARRHLVKSRSTSHSPLGASIHLHGVSGASLGTISLSPSLSHTSISLGSDLSTPSSSSHPPSPLPTFPLSPHPYEEPMRYSSPLPPLAVKLNAPSTGGLNPYRRRNYHVPGPESSPSTNRTDIISS